MECRCTKPFMRMENYQIKFVEMRTASYEVRFLKMKKLAVKLAERSGAMNRIKGKKKLRDLRLKIVELKKKLKTLKESLAKAEGKLLGNSTVGVLSLKELEIVERLGFGGKIYAVQSIVEEEEGNGTLKAKLFKAKLEAWGNYTFMKC